MVFILTALRYLSSIEMKISEDKLFDLWPSFKI